MAQTHTYSAYPNQPRPGYAVNSGGGYQDGVGYPGPPTSYRDTNGGADPPQGIGMPLTEIYNYDESSSRNYFVRRVFFLLSLMLAFSAVCIMSALLIDSVGEFFLDHPYLFWISIAFYFVTSLSITCCPIARVFPWNYICLFLATASMSLLACCITVRYKTSTVAIAFLVTCLLCILLTMLACTNFDFTKYFIYLVAFSIIMLIFGIVFIFVTMFFKYIKIMHIVYAMLCTLLLSASFIMEMQMILGGKTLELDPSEYVCGAFMLYSSIMNLFLNMLQLLQLFD